MSETIYAATIGETGKGEYCGYFSPEEILRRVSGNRLSHAHLYVLNGSDRLSSVHLWGTADGATIDFSIQCWSGFRILCPHLAHSEFIRRANEVWSQPDREQRISLK